MYDWISINCSIHCLRLALYCNPSKKKQTLSKSKLASFILRYYEGKKTDILNESSVYLQFIPTIK